MAMFETIQHPQGSPGVGEPVAGPPGPIVATSRMWGVAKDEVYSFTADPSAVAAIAGGYHSSPFDILGIHPLTAAVSKPTTSTIRTAIPLF